MPSPLIEARKQLLANRLMAVERLVHRLTWSRERVGFPLTGSAVATMDEARAESLSAFLERFAKLQDLLGATFREVVSLSGQPSDDYNLVLSAIEKMGIANGDHWRELRVLRNDVAHEYSLDVGRQAQLFNARSDAATALSVASDRLARYCSDRLSVQPATSH